MSPDDLTGRTIAGYHLEERVGEGGTAVVYRAQHPEQGVCALKVMRAIEESNLATRINSPVRPPCSSIGKRLERAAGIEPSFGLLGRQTGSQCPIPAIGADPQNRTEILRSSGACMDHHC